MTYVSTNNGETWKSLIAMIQEGDTEKIMFLTHQLDLFEKLTSVSDNFTYFVNKNSQSGVHFLMQSSLNTLDEKLELP